VVVQATDLGHRNDSTAPLDQTVIWRVHLE
jgi:hypothetical protein